MSKLRAKHGNCTVVGCAEQHKTLHLPPASEERRAEWVRFIFRGDAPATVVKNLYVCANHFASDCFTNLGQYRAGLAKKLFLKEESVPTVRDKSADEGNTKRFREVACQTEPETGKRGVDAECQTEPTPQPRCRFCGVVEQAATEQINRKTPRRGGDSNYLEISNGVCDGDESNGAAQRLDVRRTLYVKGEEGSEASRHTPVSPTHLINTDVKMETDLVILSVKEEQEEVGVDLQKGGAACENVGRVGDGDESNVAAQRLDVRTLYVKGEEGSEASRHTPVSPAHLIVTDVKIETDLVILTVKEEQEEVDVDREKGSAACENLGRSQTNVDPGGGGAGMQTLFREHQDDVDISGDKDMNPAETNIVVVGDLSVNALSTTAVKQEEGSEASSGFVKSNRDPRDAEFLRESLPSVCSAAGNKRSERAEDWVESRTQEGEVNVGNPWVAKAAKKSRQEESTT